MGKNTVVETQALLVATYDDATATKTMVFKLFHCLCDGRESADDKEERSRCPLTSVIKENISKTEVVVHTKQRLMIWEQPRDFNMPYGLLQQILSENLNMHCVSPKFCLVDFDCCHCHGDAQMGE